MPIPLLLSLHTGLHKLPTLRCILGHNPSVRRLAKPNNLKRKNLWFTRGFSQSVTVIHCLSQVAEEGLEPPTRGL